MCVCALGLSYAVYKCLLITTFNFKARAHRTSRGRETVVSAILNIVADTRTETGTHTHSHAHAFTHITCCGTYTRVRALADNFWVWVGATLFAQRSPPRSVNLFAAQPGLASAENSCAVHSCPDMCGLHPPLSSHPFPFLHSNLSSTLWRHCA